jgi:hypothetical protein
MKREKACSRTKSPLLPIWGTTTRPSFTLTPRCAQHTRVSRCSVGPTCRILSHPAYYRLEPPWVEPSRLQTQARDLTAFDGFVHRPRFSSRALLSTLGSSQPHTYKYLATIPSMHHRQRREKNREERERESDDDKPKTHLGHRSALSI